MVASVQLNNAPGFIAAQKPTKTADISRWLRCSVSALAISAVVYCQTLSARADSDDHGAPWISLEGQAFWTAGDDQIWTELGNRPANSQSVFTVDPERGLSGRVGFGLPVMPGLSVAAFARFGVAGKGEDAASIAPGAGIYLYNVLGGGNATFYYTGSVVHKEKHHILDFEVRKDVGLGMGIEAAVTGGIRYAAFKANTDTTLLYSAGLILNETREASFNGFGPRLGLDVRVPISGHWKLDVSGAGSALRGKKRIKSFAAGGYVAAGGANVSNSATVWNLEGSAAATYSMGKADFSFGVRAEKWWGVYDQTRLVALNGDFGNKDADRLMWGPFARLTIKMGGDDD